MRYDGGVSCLFEFWWVPTTKRRALFFPDVLGKIKFMATFSTVLFLASITFCHVESVCSMYLSSFNLMLQCRILSKITRGKWEQVNLKSTLVESIVICLPLYSEPFPTTINFRLEEKGVSYSFPGFHSLFYLSKLFIRGKKQPCSTKWTLKRPLDKEQYRSGVINTRHNESYTIISQ